MRRLVHDLGRVAVPVRIWVKTAPLTADDWERVRLHAYHSEQILIRSPVLAALAPVATFHHERLDGSGYHRGAAAAALSLPRAGARHRRRRPRHDRARPHREALAPGEAAETLAVEARAGRGRDLAIPPDVTEEKFGAYLEDLLHEAGSPGLVVRRIR